MPHAKSTAAKTSVRRGGILSLILALLGFTILGSVGYSLFPRTGMQPVAPDRDDLELTLYRVGLKPEFLAAAGVSSTETTAIVSNMRTHLSTAMPGLEASDAAYHIEKSQVEQLRRIVRAGKGSDQQVRELASSKTSLATAEAERDGMLDAAFAAATESLGTEQVSTLANLRANGQRWHLPTEHLTVNRTDAEWIDLRNALANDRISDRLGREPDVDQQALLAQANSNANVVAARQGASNLATVESAWNEAVAD